MTQPHLERFTPSTKLNPNLCSSKCLTPTYKEGSGRNLHPPPPPTRVGGGAETMGDLSQNPKSIKRPSGDGRFKGIHTPEPN